MTKINREDIPKDHLLSSTVIKDATASGAYSHITEAASKIIKTPKKALVCSVNEAVYAGCITGVAERKKANNNYSSRIRLEDVCHNAERIMFPANPMHEEDWVLDTIKNEIHWQIQFCHKEQLQNFSSYEQEKKS